MRLKSYEKKADDIRKRYDKELEELGEKVRAEVITPVCKKLELEFLSGNGTFCFCYRDQTYAQQYELEQAPQALRRALTPILELLNKRLDHNDYLGFYVGNVQSEKKINTDLAG